MTGRPPSCTCGECPKCRHAAYVRAWYATKSPEWRREATLRRDTQRLRAFDRERSSTDARRATKRASHRRFIERNPEKAKAWQRLNDAVRSGRIIRQPCSMCGDPKSHAHHPDYSKPLDVIWLCSYHHNAIHGRLRPDAAKIREGTF